MKTARVRRTGRAHPLRMYLSFVLSSVVSFVKKNSAALGRRRKGRPIMTAMPDWDGKRLCIKSNTAAAAMALRATCGRLNKLITHTRVFPLSQKFSRTLDIYAIPMSWTTAAAKRLTQ